MKGFLKWEHQLDKGDITVRLFDNYDLHCLFVEVEHTETRCRDDAYIRWRYQLITTDHFAGFPWFFRPYLYVVAGFIGAQRYTVSRERDRGKENDRVLQLVPELIDRVRKHVEIRKQALAAIGEVR